jgi:hypothetical protein
MTTRKLSVLALLLMVPIALQAQRSKRGFGAGGGSDEADKMIKETAESPSLSKDLQKANPIELLLDKKKDLGITKDEEKEIKAINDQLKDAVKPFFKAIDSVSRENKKTGDYAPTQGQMLMGRQLSRSSADSVRAKYDAAAEQAVSKLAEDRRQPAKDLLAKEQEEQMKNARGRSGRPPV